ncbi:hypothetical protein C4B60_00670 [Jeotgalibacillus proteolyticus]|uniref:Uncharacterized protein n=1 Tax=Jeotgalibacillus proteolyticus TaxID=2082395 RepID=A0A2S5GG76_9BACL|nr:hypothetical protein C4B60_00670 [Jeotgalibacillus proteolyticus]
MKNDPNREEAQLCASSFSKMKAEIYYRNRKGHYSILLRLNYELYLNHVMDRIRPEIWTGEIMVLCVKEEAE